MAAQPRSPGVCLYRTKITTLVWITTSQPKSHIIAFGVLKLKDLNITIKVVYSGQNCIPHLLVAFRLSSSAPASFSSSSGSVLCVVALLPLSGLRSHSSIRDHFSFLTIQPAFINEFTAFRPHYRHLMDKWGKRLWGGGCVTQDCF